MEFLKIISVFLSDFKTWLGIDKLLESFVFNADSQVLFWRFWFFEPWVES